MSASSPDQHLIIAHCFDPTPDEFYDWPRHLTFVTWFTARNMNALNVELALIAESTRDFEIEVGPDALLGPKNDTPAQLIAPNQNLTELHLSIRTAIEKNGKGKIISRKFTGTGYKPHITEQPTKDPYKEGEHLKVDGFYLIAGSSSSKHRKNGLKTIMSRYPLNDETTT